MLRVAVVTIFPELLAVITDYGVTGRAIRSGLLQVTAVNPRDYTSDKHRTVDDRPYGGGPGMVMSVAPLRGAIQAARQVLDGARVIYLSPQGQRLNQQAVKRLAGYNDMIMLAGRYEGIDERLIGLEVDEEWSIGDYVLSGGELPAMVLIDAMARTVPGVLGHEASAVEDSFVNGILDYPHYTRPESVAGLDVPEVLLGGNHARIERWRLKQALGRTWQRRPDLLQDMQLDEMQQGLLEEFIQEQETQRSE
jgi:tRNA (guanine37-N1)-methyltransferase